MVTKRYTKKDFIKDISNNGEMLAINKSELLEIMRLFIIYFQQALRNGYDVDLRGMGIFSIKKIPAREQAWNVNKGRRLFNNKHKEARIKFPPTNSVRYKPSITLRKILNAPKPETVIRDE